MITHLHLMAKEVTMAILWFCFTMLSWTYINSISLGKTLVDLTYTFDNETISLPTERKFEIYTMNRTVNDTYWIQLEEYSSSTHVGTHMDAPCHFAESRWSVDEIPLERLMAPVAVIDIEEKSATDVDYLVTIDDLETWENETGQSLSDSILLIQSGWGKKWGDVESFIGTSGNDSKEFHFPAIAPETAQWLVDERNVYGVGTDASSLDNTLVDDFRTHRILLEANIFGLENVANIDKLPIYGATLYVLPMKISNGCAAPTRIVATFPDIVYQSSTKTKVLREVIIFS